MNTTRNAQASSNSRPVMSEPVVVIIGLQYADMFECIYHHFLSALQKKADVRKVASKPDALRYLSSPSPPHAVLLCDAAITEKEFRDVLVPLVSYVKRGGTAVCMGVFSGWASPDDLTAMFATSWGLSWSFETYGRYDWVVSPCPKGLDVKGLTKAYSMKAVILSNVPVESAVYFDPYYAEQLRKGKGKARAVLQESCECTAAFAAVGEGYLGYVGDVNGEPETTAVILAMTFHPAARSKAPTAVRSAAQGSGPPKPNVLVISLEKAHYTDDTYDQLYRALRKNATVIEALHSRSANKALSGTPRPSAVLVSDAAITQPKYAALLARLIEYARGGGRVVLGVQFSNHFQLDTVGPFFRKWGLALQGGSYHRTTFGLNPAGVPAPLKANMLFPTVSMKALHLKNVPRECAVYLPTPASHLESMVYAPTPITGDKAEESPAVWARVGDGYLGYVGDVNAEQGSIRLTLEMCEVQIEPGDLGPTQRSTNVCVHPDGRREVEKQLEEEVPFPSLMASTSTLAAVSSAILNSSSAANAGTVKGSSDGPALVPTTLLAATASGSSGSPALVPTTLLAPTPACVLRSPARPREAEVIARAAQRAKVREEKNKRADALKEEGNALFRGQEGQWAQAAEKYRAAALTAGPQPVYMSNLAAALLKLQRWTLAESAASRALMRDPGHIKSLYRRAQARKQMCMLAAAEADLRRILAQESSNALALAEMESVLIIKRMVPGEDRTEDHDLIEDVLDLEEESDSEDYKHKGNGTPCRFHNRRGCTQGARCRFSHAPDAKSVRDELCVPTPFMILGRSPPLTRSLASTKRCQYAHDRTYLPARGWWTDEARNARLYDAMDATRDDASKALLVWAAKPLPWREELWVTAKFTAAPGIPSGGAGTGASASASASTGAKNKKNGKKGKKTRKRYMGMPGLCEYNAGPSEYSGYSGYGHDPNEDDTHERHMKEFHEEMLLQGIKPGEVRSMNELAEIDGTLGTNSHYLELCLPDVLVIVFINTEASYSRGISVPATCQNLYISPLATGTTNWTEWAAVAHSLTTYHRPSMPTTSKTAVPPKPNILVISLEKEPYIEEIHDQLYRALRKNATVTEVLDARSANRALSSPTHPSAILVSDAAVTRPAHAALLARLIEYTRGGGRVVLGMQLSNHFQLDTVGPFFRKWGLAWDKGSYHRTTFGLNPAGVPAPLDPSTLFPAVSMKAVHLKNVPRECAVYLPTPASRLESIVHASTPITGDKAQESPAVWARIGDGYLGYIGDVNGEQGTTRLTLEMCEVKIQPGDLGSTERSIGITIHPDGRQEVVKRLEEEVPLPALKAPSSTSAAVSAAIMNPSSGALSGAASGSSGNAAPAPPLRPCPFPHPPRRAKVREEKIKRADVLKEEGNALFRQGQKEQWVQAAEKYRVAALIAGPQPVYVANLAAALLKLQQWMLAESAASRALMREPDHAKALFRRAQARKEMGMYAGAETDLRRVLAQDSTNIAALVEMESVHALKRMTHDDDIPDDDDALADVLDTLDLEEESDSEDYTHQGNGTPCRFYNRHGCTHGARCRFTHAPDRKSVRDELGRNVCIYWLLDECRFGDAKCQYAHDRTYLPERGWWTDEARNARLRELTDMTFDAMPRRYLPQAFLAEGAKPYPWREELWATADYTDATEIPRASASANVTAAPNASAGGKKNKKKKGKKSKSRSTGAGMGMGGYGAGPSGYDGYGGYGDYGYDSDEDDRHMEDFYEEMLLQGIKPWEVESMDELAAIHGALYDGY
ncbi:hypothetical protein VTO73DRAFT_6285 [Trametes versicolor]